MFLLLASASTAHLHAWSAQGHRLVALIATERLTPVARRNVTWLLGPESLADVSSWADRYLEGNFQTFFWHFLNIPPDATSYDRDRDCPMQPGVSAGMQADKWRDCAVDRILYNKARLADTSLDRSDRAIALKFLVHIVGDLHQPFHALGVGRGGNDVPVSIFGEKTCGANPCNLHSAWDRALIAHRNLDDGQYLSVLRNQIRQTSWDARATGGPAEWAMQSHGLAKAALLQAHGAVDETYYRKHISVVEERLALGGLRLAALLNESLTASLHAPAVIVDTDAGPDDLMAIAYFAWDPLAAVALVDPSVVRLTPNVIEIRQNPPEDGRSVFVHGIRPNAEVAIDADARKFRDLFVRTLAASAR